MTFSAPPTPPEVRKLEIRVSTEEAELGRKKSLVPTERRMGEVAPGVAAIGIYAAGQPNFDKALLKVALAAWTVSDQFNLRPGSTQTPALRRSAETKIRAAFTFTNENLRGVRWATPVVSYQYRAADDTWILQVIGVRVASGAEIAVPVRIRPLTEKGRQKAQKIADDLQKSVTEKLADDRDTFKDAVPTAAQMEDMLRKLDGEPGLSHAATASSAESLLKFESEPDWTRFGFDLKAGVSYTPENSVTGDADFSGNNLLRRGTNDGRRVETTSVNLSGAYELQKLTAGWSVRQTWERALGAKHVWGFRLGGRVVHDRRQLFGPPPEKYAVQLAGPGNRSGAPIRVRIEETPDGDGSRHTPVQRETRDGPGVHVGPAKRESEGREPPVSASAGTTLQQGWASGFHFKADPSLLWRGSTVTGPGWNEARLTAKFDGWAGLGLGDFQYHRGELAIEASTYLAGRNRATSWRVTARATESRPAGRRFGRSSGWEAPTACAASRKANGSGTVSVIRRRRSGCRRNIS